GRVDEVRDREVAIRRVMVDVERSGSRRERELRALDRTEVHGDDEVHVSGWRGGLEALGSGEEPIGLGNGIGAVQRHRLPDRRQTEAERDRRADGVWVRVAVRHDRDARSAPKLVERLAHSLGFASRSSVAMRAERSADRSDTKMSSGTKRSSTREPSSCRRYG